MKPGTTQLSRTADATRRRTIARYERYDEAERAVDALSDLRFPVARAAIVGIGLRSVERVVGRVTTWRRALICAGQAAPIGLFVGLLSSLFFTGPGCFAVLADAVADEARRVLAQAPWTRLASTTGPVRSTSRARYI